MVLGQCWEHAELALRLQSEARRNSQCCATVLLQCLLRVLSEDGLHGGVTPASKREDQSS